MDSKKKNIVTKWKSKYRFIVLNDKTFEEVWQIRLSKINVFTFFGTGIIFLIALVVILIAFTGLKEFIPGYPDGNMQKNIWMNALKVDSLEYEITIRDQYLKNLSNIMNHRTLKDLENTQELQTNEENIDLEISKEDSLLREQIEQEERYNLSFGVKEPEKNTQIFNVHFFSPVKGLVVNSFNISENHFGTDIVAPTNEVVKATLDGTVIMATWTLETGYVIQIQHDHEILSVYKHNAELLKKMGDNVKAGEAIAIIGNSGELTTGPHLHFELWHRGAPINPEEFVNF